MAEFQERSKKHKISRSHLDKEGLNVARLQIPAADTNKLIQEFKSEYKERGNRELLYQIPYLSKLADAYQLKDDWASLLRAHSLYNSCAVRDTENSEQWLGRAYEVQVKYWQTDLQNFHQHLQVAQALKCELEEIRGRWRKRTDRIAEHFNSLNCEPNKLSCPENKELYIKILQDIPASSESLNQAMVAFSSTIVERAQLICGPQRCRFCVVGLGSMAKGEATPYSDLEFLFLVETTSDEAMQYFRRLAVTIYFLIGNMGETKLKVMAIPELMTWDEAKGKFVAHWFDDTGMSGFKIDGLGSWAGNIPTGGTPEQSDQFICTVKELAEKYKTVLDMPDPKKALTGDLTAMLANTVFIHGHQSLHVSFRSLINSYQPNALRKDTTLLMLAKDAAKFNFKPDEDLTSKKHLKSDIYRYPSLLVLNLKILHDIESSNPWHIIDLLQDRRIISASTAESLRFSLCCALFIRLSAYLYHDSQNDSISVLSTNRDENLYKGAWYVRPELLTHMFIHLVPLKEAVSKLAKNPGEVIDVEVTERSRIETVAVVGYHCNNFPSVVSLVREVYLQDIDLESADPHILQIYIQSAIDCQKYEEAEKLLKNKIQSQKYDEYDLFLLGRFYGNQDRLSQALDAYMTELAVVFSLHDFTDNVAIAHCYNSIGGVLHRLSKHTEALTLYKRCLDMRQRLLGEGDHLKIAWTISNIASVLSDQSEFEEAYTKYRKCLDMMMRIYGDRDHVDIAYIFANLGTILSEMSRHTEALDELNKALDMMLRIYDGREHVKIAHLLCNIGTTLDDIGKYDEALIEYEKSRRMWHRLFGGRDMEGTADVIHNIGVTLDNQGKPAEAVVQHKASLEMYRRIFGSQDHQTIADIQCCIGTCLDQQGMHTEALAEYSKCLDMYRRLFGDRDNVGIALVHRNIGNVLCAQDQDAEGLGKYMESLDMTKRIFGDDDHVDVADTLFNIGVTLYDLGRVEEALVTLEKSLDMLTRLFGEEGHPSIDDVKEHIKLIANDGVLESKTSDSETSDLLSPPDVNLSERMNTSDTDIPESVNPSE